MASFDLEFSGHPVHLRFNSPLPCYWLKKIEKCTCSYWQYCVDFSDTADCIKCPDDQYPNRNQNVCIPKLVTFLSYDEPLGIGIAICALSLLLTTAVILGLFIKHRDTPMVKANNKDLTYILLISLCFWFLSVLFQIGQPQKVTCILRQIAFGFSFTMAVSAIIAKTVTVVLAFMAIHPGSKMKKWMGKKLTSSIVLSSCIIKAGICIGCLVTSPPFTDSDMHSSPETIVLQCIESPPLKVYFDMTFIGLLALVSCIVASFTQKLPNTFNEAILITLSLHVLYCLWISFLPIYLTTTGKFQAGAESFTIILSGAGLLACIFVPKCYIILWKPELNKREHFRKR